MSGLGVGVALVFGALATFATSVGVPESRQQRALLGVAIAVLVLALVVVLTSYQLWRASGLARAARISVAAALLAVVAALDVATTSPGPDALEVLRATASLAAAYWFVAAALGSEVDSALAPLASLTGTLLMVLAVASVMMLLAPATALTAWLAVPVLAASAAAALVNLTPVGGDFPLPWWLMWLPTTVALLAITAPPLSTAAMPRLLAGWVSIAVLALAVWGATHRTANVATGHRDDSYLRRSHDSALRRARGELEREQRHDVRNSIAAMEAVIVTLAHGSPGRTDRSQLHGALQAELSQLRALLGVDDPAPRQRRDDHETQPQPTDIDALVAQQATLTRAAGHAVTVAGTGGMVLADPNAVGRLLRNLLINAERHGRDATGRATVAVTVRRQGPDLHIRISDRGPGIPPALSERVFQREVTSSGGIGRGVGLHTVRKLAHSAGGDVRLLPTPAPGTTFELYLPDVALPSAVLADERQDRLEVGKTPDLAARAAGNTASYGPWGGIEHHDDRRLEPEVAVDDDRDVVPLGTRAARRGEIDVRAQQVLQRRRQQLGRDGDGNARSHRRSRTVRG